MYKQADAGRGGGTGGAEGRWGEGKSGNRADGMGEEGDGRAGGGASAGGIPDLQASTWVRWTQGVRFACNQTCYLAKAL